MNNYPLRSKKRAERAEVQVYDLTLDSSSDDERISRNTQPRQEDGVMTVTHPELVTSSGNHPSETALFDEQDFEELRQRYLLPRIHLNSELPTGMTLRRTCRARLIDLKTPGFQRLRVRIDELIKKNDKLEVYRLLCQVRSYEIDPSRVPQVMQERNQDGDVTELFDLTQDIDDDCLNVDEYITDVLLPREDDYVSRPDCVVSTDVKKEKIDDDAMSSTKRELWQEVQSVVIEAQETPFAPETTRLVVQVTPEKPMDLSSVAAATQVSSHALQMPVRSINKIERSFLDFDRSEYNQAVRMTQMKILQMTLQKNDVEQVYQMKGRNKALAKRISLLDSKPRDELIGTAHQSEMIQRNVCVLSVSVMPSKRLLVLRSKPSNQGSLAKEWRSQTRRRRQGEWVPNGHITGRWKPPSWDRGDSSQSKNEYTKHSGCKKSLLPTLHSLVSAYLKATAVVNVEGPFFKSLQHVKCPTYLDPSCDLLSHAHRAVSSLLPDGDCEEFDVVKLARTYYDYWRPDEVKVILLAESHAHTNQDRAFDGPKFNRTLLKDAYDGPCDFISLVYCLAYGENESLAPSMKDKNNKGTTQFWTLFAAIDRGVDHVAPCKPGKDFASPFAADVLKGGGLPFEERLRAKLKILENLKRRGIWLLDVSIFGWYISQPQKYRRSSISNEVHRMQKARPPLGLKAPSLVLSWELYTKHVIRKVAEEGHLKLLIPIGMEVELAVTRQRMDEAISVCAGAEVTNTFPAPNAWITGGYGPWHAKLQQLVEKAAPA